MFKLANGWTKDSVMAQVKKYNNGTPAMRDDWSCRYQAADGNRCAIGCFIPDAHIGLNHAGPVEQLLYYYPSLTSCMPFNDVKALIGFQMSHDDCSIPKAATRSTHEAIQKFLDEEVE